MIQFFKTEQNNILAIECQKPFTNTENEALTWLFSGAKAICENETCLKGIFVGPRKEMVTPWSTTAVEITQNMNIEGITRIEEYFSVENENAEYDKMLQRMYKGLDNNIFTTENKPEPIKYIDNLEEYNKKEGLALSTPEIQYLESLSQKIGRKLTDSEVFGFSQVNSEHCRHKIFNGTFIIDGNEMKSSLFAMIKKTSKLNPNRIVSAYKDNCAFITGPRGMLFFAPKEADTSSYFQLKPYDAVISLKAETHNFPTTVEPFNGAATGSGGEIRDRMAGGKVSYPLAGTAVYMTCYPRFNGENVEDAPKGRATEERKWLYQSPEELLTKASNGASDFGNKFGQPVITGSLLCFEHKEENTTIGYDKVIMLAGGVGYAKEKDAQKEKPGVGDSIVLLGGDNYRIGMGGGAVSSVNTGEYKSAIELNAIQRSNPEMQKRVYNALRAMADSDENPIITLHDHGAGGHLNCLSELVEETGGKVDIATLPVGDNTLSDMEIVGNESQERMGMVIKEKDVALLRRTADRERAPMYEIGKITGDMRFTFEDSRNGNKPIDLDLKDMFGSAPKTIMEDKSICHKFQAEDSAISELSAIKDNKKMLEAALARVLQVESVACKDWLTNKVDRSVTGLIARQQCVGELQLPLADYGMTALSYAPQGKQQKWEGIATSVGHAPVAALVDAGAGSRLSIAEALTNLVFAPIEDSIKSVSLSANWMWPCKNEGEDARLYSAVKAASEFAIALGINIPTGKDSLSLTQKYPDGQKVMAPGTVIISTVAPVSDIRKGVSPELKANHCNSSSTIVYVPFTNCKAALGATAFASAYDFIGQDCADVCDTTYFKDCFNAVQKLVDQKLILAGHDVSAGGLITALLEMTFPTSKLSMNLNVENICKEQNADLLHTLFAESPAVVLQVADNNLNEIQKCFAETGVKCYILGKVVESNLFTINGMEFQVADLRRKWFRTSMLMDKRQSGEKMAMSRYDNLGKTPMVFAFPKGFNGKLDITNGMRPKAAIIREKGSNGDREMAWMLYLAGFDVKDVHVTDLASGREDLKDISFIVFVGGFSNSDVLGSAKGWAGAFLYNKKAKEAIDNFYKRTDTLSLGICNGCQLMAELGLITPEDRGRSPKMLHNDSHKFESNFVNITIEDSPSILLSGLKNARLGIWVAHGEGKFSFPEDIKNYNIAARYSYGTYPANPNGSPENAAAVCSTDGRHLAMMPHPERCIYPWNWAYYPQEREDDEVTPWLDMFIKAREWVLSQK